jgi:aldehyde dehydrogenase (NAD+)
MSELGGKSPNIVFADADLDSAARASASGIFFNAGQVCSAGSRILVQRDCYAEFVDRLARRAEGLVQGDPRDPGTTLGPLISRPQQQRVLGYIEAGVAEGARLVCGGSAGRDTGFFVEPTIFAGVDNAMKIAQEEIFGPVATVVPFADENDAIALANDSPYSLAAAVWTRDITRGHVMAERLRAGTVWINTYGHTDTRLPWGGCGGESGVGRDLGRAAIDNYTEQKTVWLNLSAPRAA